MLPTSDKARKDLPIWSGCLMYFPDVWAEIARVSKIGNDQHNPGEPLHWAREKSTDQMNTAFRHMLDYGSGVRIDSDGGHHLAKAIWRLCAELQLDIERDRTIIGGGAEMIKPVDSPPWDPRVTTPEAADALDKAKAACDVYMQHMVKVLEEQRQRVLMAKTDAQLNAIWHAQHKDSPEWCGVYMGEGKFPRYICSRPPRHHGDHAASNDLGEKFGVWS